MMLPSLELDQPPVFCAPNPGTCTLISGTSRRQPILISAAGDCINILDRQARLQDSLPFELAFPVHDQLKQLIDALAFDPKSGRIAACSGGKVGVWEPAGRSYRVHSSFNLTQNVTALDYKSGTIAGGGSSGVAVWAVDETRALPSWSRVAHQPSSSGVLAAKLSPSAGLLATVNKGSTTVRISAIIPGTSTSSGTLRFRSHASHSLKIRTMDWRPTDDPADSGPILFTTTLDGVFRIWGCMIDEPDFFSLWATLDVHTTLPKHIPLATCFRQTKAMWPAVEGQETRRGTADEFVTVFSDGSVHQTTVTHFDCRPPTCLSQSTRVIKGVTHPTTDLVNLRYPLLLPSPASSDGFVLLGRSSLGTLTRTSVTSLTDPTSTTTSAPASAHTASVPVNLVGTVRALVPTFCGEAVLAVGSNGRIQNWETAEDDLVVETFASEVAVEEGAGVATWHDGRMVAVVGKGKVEVFEFERNGRLALVASAEHSLSAITTMFVARTQEDSPNTTIVAVAANAEVTTWTYSATRKQIFEGSTQSLRQNSLAEVAFTAAVPVREYKEREEEVSMVVVDMEGTFAFRTMDLADEDDEWKAGQAVRTGRSGIRLVACSADRLTALVAETEGAFELSIWDSNSSEFTTGQQFATTLDEPVVDLHWSLDGLTLAVATPSQVWLWCAQRLDDITGKPPWAAYAAIPLDATSSDISTVCWLANGLAIAAGDHLFFHSPKLDTGRDSHALAEERSGPLPYTHPQLLLQALLHGHLTVVIKILVGLAAQLTPDGDVTPIEGSHSGPRRVGVADFVAGAGVAIKGASVAGAGAGGAKDIFSALTAVAESSRREADQTLTDEASDRLLAALKKNPMRGLTKLEHAHLAVVVQTVHQIQRQRGSLDANGLRYLISMRSFFIYNTTQLPTDAALSLPRLKYRDAVWAFHSENQELLLEESVKACPQGRLGWDNAKALGLFFWLKSPEVLAKQLEAVGRAEYSDPSREDKDPITASLFYLALRKKHIVQTLWKQAIGHGDRVTMIKMMGNDFELPRWKTAALKNAFALLSKRRFMFAATFFLLGDSLKDAVNVCVRQLDDLPLAVAIARVYEGDEGPVLKSLLEVNVLPVAFTTGDRWLASWAFWMLNRRDLAIQTIITPLADLATRLPTYNLTSVGSPMHEDPGLVLLYGQLRSWSLQTVKGAMAISGKTEFNFVLHMSRVLCRMGCHALALSLVASWQFPPPPRPTATSNSSPFSASTSTSARRPSLHDRFSSVGGGPAAHPSLRRLSTKLDMPIPPSVEQSRAPSPVQGRAGDGLLDAGAGGQAEVERKEDKAGEEGKTPFRAVLKEAKVAAQAPAEFSFDSFGF